MSSTRDLLGFAGLGRQAGCNLGSNPTWIVVRVHARSRASHWEPWHWASDPGFGLTREHARPLDARPWYELGVRTGSDRVGRGPVQPGTK